MNLHLSVHMNLNLSFGNKTKQAAIEAKKLNQIIYYERYVVINPGIKEEDGCMKMDLLTEEENLNVIDSLPKDNQILPNDDPNKFIAKKRKSIDDSCEIFIDNEFIGLIYIEDDEGEVSYQFHMTILKEDLLNS